MSSVSPHALEGTALIVHVIKARGLSGAPLVVKQRPYVVLRLGCVEYATNSAKRGLRRHVWDEKFSLPLQTSRDALEVSCFSSHVTKNTSGSHLIGRGTVHVSTVSKKEGGHNAWVKLDNGGEVLLDITRPAHPPLPPSVPRPRPISFPSIMPMMQSYKRLHSEIGSWNSVKSPPCKRSRLSLETSRPAIWRTSFRPNAPINTDQQSSFPSAIGAGPSKSSTSLGRESPPLDADDNAGVAVNHSPTAVPLYDYLAAPSRTRSAIVRDRWALWLTRPLKDAMESAPHDKRAGHLSVVWNNPRTVRWKSRTHSTPLVSVGA